MSVAGVAVSPSAYCLQLPPRGRVGARAICGRISAFSQSGLPRKFLRLEGNCSVQLSNKHFQSRTPVIKCAMDASYGDSMNNQYEVFPRINIKDPYKRLGISREASQEEIQAARNFLIQRYAGHKPSVDAIEEAHDKIIMQQFHERKRPKLNIKKKVRDVTQNRYVQAVLNRFKTPADTKFIVLTAVTFVMLGVLTFLFPTEEGPTLQVAISLMATIYFIHSRLKSKIRAVLYGVGAFIVSWLLGTFLMVSVIPPIPVLMKGPTSLEVMTALISYVFLWISSTYLN